MKPNPECDVLIIGAGATGSLAATVLARAGLDVVCLEQGSWVEPGDHPHYSSDWTWQRRTNWNSDVNKRHHPDDYPVESDSLAGADVERGRRLDQRLRRHLAALPSLRFPQGRRARAAAQLAHRLRGHRALLRGRRPADRHQRSRGRSRHAAPRALPHGPPALHPRGRAPCRVLRQARLALVAGRSGRDLGKLRRPPGLQRLRHLQRLPARLDEQVLALDLAEGAGGRHPAPHPRPRAADRERPRRPRQRRHFIDRNTGLHRVPGRPRSSSWPPTGSARRGSCWPPATSPTAPTRWAATCSTTRSSVPRCGWTSRSRAIWAMWRR